MFVATVERAHRSPPPRHYLPGEKGGWQRCVNAMYITAYIIRTMRGVPPTAYLERR